MKKLLTSLLCVMMVVCFMPAMAWADGDVAAATLPEAVDGIITISKDGSYEISENLTASIVIEAEADVTLTVNGTLTNSDGSDTITVEKNAKLTIKGTGTVDNITHAKAAVLNNGETIINGGTFTRSQENGKNKGDNGDNSFYAILNHGTMTIDGEGVTVSQDGHYSSLIENGYQSYKSSANSRMGYVESVNSPHPTLTIVEGTFNGGLNTIKNDDGGILEINGGTFSNTTQASLLNWNIATITGGNFDCTSDDNEVFGNYNAILVGHDSANTTDDDECLNQGKLIINGGTFTSTNEVIEQMNGSNGNGDVSISGGTFISEGNDAISSEMTDQTTITSGIFSSKVSAADNTEVISITSSEGNSKLYYVGASITDEVLADAVENGASVADVTADVESAVYVVAFNYADDIKETAYVIADKDNNYQISEPDKPTRNGYTFLGWYNGDQLFDFNQSVSSNVVLTAKWSKNVYIPTTPTVQKPVIEPNADVTTSLSSDGTALTIKANDGYEITDVAVNGVSKGAVTTLTGLKTGDKIVITTQKIETPDDNAALIEAVKNTKLIARSAMSTAKGKKAVKVSWYAEDGSDLDFDGYEVFRSLKRYSGFGTTPIFKTANEKYYNTAIKKGNKYYYKVRAYKVIDGEKVYTDWSTKAWRTVK